MANELNKPSTKITSEAEAIDYVKSDGNNLEHVPNEFKSNEVCLAAVQQNGYAIDFVPKDILTEPICLAAIRQNGYSIDYILDDIKTVNMYLSAVQHGYALEYIPEDKKTYDICLAAVQANGLSLRSVPDEKKKEEICSEAVKNKGAAIYFVPEKMKSEALCSIAVQKNGAALENVPEDKKTHDVCLTAVKQTGFALEYVPKDRKTEDVCYAAVKQEGYAIKYVPEDMKTERICLAAVQQNGLVLDLIPKEKRTKDICLAAIQNNNDAIQYVPSGFLRELIKDMNEKNNSLITPENLHTVQCIWEFVMEMQITEDPETICRGSTNFHDAIIETRERNGIETVRQYMRDPDLIESIEKGWTEEVKGEMCFDWEYVPQFLSNCLDGLTLAKDWEKRLNESIGQNISAHQKTNQASANTADNKNENLITESGFVVRWEHGPHGDISGRDATFGEAVQSAMVGIEDWWRSMIEENGAEVLEARWKERLHDMRVEVCEVNGRREAGKCLWPTTEADFAQIDALGKRILDEALKAKMQGETAMEDVKQNVRQDETGVSGPQIDKDDLRDLGKAVENAMGSGGLYALEVQDKFAELGITDGDQAWEMLEQIPMVVISHNEPGYLPDSEPYAIFVGLKGEEDLDRVKDAVAEEVELYYEDSEHEEEAFALADEIRKASDEKIKDGITARTSSGHVFEANFTTAAELCSEMQIIKGNELSSEISAIDTILKSNSNVIDNYLHNINNPSKISDSMTVFLELDLDDGRMSTTVVPEGNVTIEKYETIYPEDTPENIVNLHSTADAHQQMKNEGGNRNYSLEDLAKVIVPKIEKALENRAEQKKEQSQELDQKQTKSRSR